MKSLYILLAVFCVTLQASAQTAKPTTPKPVTTPAKTPAPKPATQTKPATAKAPVNGSLANHYLVKYATAARWNDTDVAKDALYDLLIENPADSLIFTLAYSYYEDQKYLSAALVSQDFLARNPKSVDFLQLAASSYEQVGAMERSLQAYESLYLITNATSALYKTAFLQFQLKKYVECMTNIDILLSKEDVDKNTASFEDAEKKPKDYSIRVPLLNLKGMILQETDKVAAKKAFEDALAIAPDFLTAKQNLEKLK